MFTGTFVCVWEMVVEEEMCHEENCQQPCILKQKASGHRDSIISTELVRLKKYLMYFQLGFTAWV